MYYLRRILWLLPLVVVIAFCAFVLVRVAPGGPFDKERAPASPEIDRALRAKYHLDEPFWKQFGRYLAGLAGGDFGPSMKYRNHTVNDILRQGLPISFALGALAFAFSLALGVPWGVWTAGLKDRRSEALANAVPVLAVSIPAFVVGPVLVLLLAIHWRWFPVGLWGGPLHWVLPVITLGLYFAGKIARLTTEGMRSMQHAEFVTTARAKGLPERSVILRHVLRLALLPVVSYSGPLLADLLTGSFVVENLFQIPGIGVFLVNSSLNRDYTIVVGLVVVYAVLLLALNLAVDFIYAVLDPRVSYE